MTQKYPCFLCLWDSWADNQEWPLRQGSKSGLHNVQSHPLVEPNKILLLPLHIKLGVMKNFVKAMDREGSRFVFVQEKFPQISMEKLKADIFDGPQIREFMKDPMFVEALNKAELFIWYSMKSVVTNFLENHGSAGYKKEIEELLKNFYKLEAWMSVKLYFLWPHFDYFHKNCRDLRDNQGEHFYQDICIMEECKQSQWDVNFLADFCWCSKWDVETTKRRRKSLKTPFLVCCGTM